MQVLTPGAFYSHVTGRRGMHSVLLLYGAANNGERLMWKFEGSSVLLKVSASHWGVSLPRGAAGRCLLCWWSSPGPYVTPEIGAFVFGFLHSNGLSTSKGVYFHWMCFCCFSLSYINTTRMKPETCFFLLHTGKFTRLRKNCSVADLLAV